MNKPIKKISWTDARAFGASFEQFTHEDWIKVAEVVDAIDPATIPEGIEIPDLRPREMIEAEAAQKQARES